MNNFDICVESVNKKPASIVEGNGEFEVINNTSEPIYFLKTDSCVYDSSDTTRCDCAIYNDNTFSFIELKCIKPKNFNKKRKEAENQLEATIQDFSNSEVIQDKILEAFVCSNCQIKTDGNFEPITKKPRNSNKESHFLLNLKTRLYYDTKKEFNYNG